MLSSDFKLRLLPALALLTGLVGCTTVPTSQNDAASTQAVGSEDQTQTADTASEQTHEQPLQRLVALTEHLSSIERKLDTIAEKLDEAAPPRAPSPTSATRASELECPDLPGDQPPNPSKTMLGTLEWIHLEPPGRPYRARVDSGANTSSISAKNVREFERDGEDWVRFTFDHDGEDPLVTIERPVERVVLIRQASAQKLDRRPVVLLTVKLGDLVQKTEFTLSDRSQMTYPVLLGREFLRDLYLIDVSKSYLHGKPGTPRSK